ncbi:inositol 1,4,5-trisphosphate receptor-interacting protein [Gambusia affinis]|uniref:inositol 1,4,5-trisphosphate receptor-interacting protein n=1 Tax=Gambusia affinis TaxID=33528 RepID=UPI001CDBA2B8|nr:inositol 1,4,5-trisphosphate receptor-interacting protein [Gambusia affinis]XP_043970134.1 inositol 1,4,5-trisphosphate receptor-interacting protein [Gambusia affinis]
MMQDTLVRVFVVAAGLLLCPRDNPGVEEWDDAVDEDLQKHEQMLLEGEEKFVQPSARVSYKIKEPQGDINKNPEQQNQSNQHDKDEPLDTDVAVAERGTFDPKLPVGHMTSKSAAVNLTENLDNQEGEDFSSGSSEQDSLQGHYERSEGATIHPEDRDSPASHVYSKTENETSEKGIAEWESDYLWYIWNTFSIISIMRFVRKYLKRNLQTDQEETRISPRRSPKVSLPDVETLQSFYAQCVQASAEKMLREKVFLEGFANDLLEAMRTVCENNGSMLIEDFQMVKERDVIVHFAPCKPYSVRCLLWNNPASDPLLDTQVCGQIKLLKEEKVPNGCPCQSADADDMVCLVHSESDKAKTKVADAFNGPLCSKNTPFLSKSKITRWFQNTVKQAWTQISHKYEFELSISYAEAPGALVVRFKSGKKINFSLKPVVKFNTEAHFCITPWSSSDVDTFWALSLSVYEDRLLEHLSKRLPVNSCRDQILEIASFLHRRQEALTGKTAVKYIHFKIALMHLLLAKKISQWQPNFATCRLQDLLSFVEECLKRKHLAHILIGNPLAEVTGLPKEICRAKPVNLFHVFVEDDCAYKNGVLHFQEMFQNAHMLIHEYVAQPQAGTKSFA